MKKIAFSTIEGRSGGYVALLGILGAFILAALGATYFMEHNGHWVTGMNNQIVWGTPHVFAVFLIVAASGALNVASISSVFNKTAYKPLARLSGNELRGLRYSLLPKKLNRRIKVATGFSQSLLAIHDARTGLFSEYFYLV